jgi:hypothetical protein
MKYEGKLGELSLSALLALSLKHPFVAGYSLAAIALPQSVSTSLFR